jgi:hypothetical protein
VRGRPTARPWPRTGELPDRRWMREFSGSPLSRRPSGSGTSIEPAASAEVPAMGALSVITIELCLTSGRRSRRSCSGGGVDCELVRRQNRPSPQSPVARRVGAATAVKVPVGGDRFERRFEGLVCSGFADMGRSPAGSMDTQPNDERRHEASSDRRVRTAMKSRQHQVVFRQVRLIPMSDIRE